MMSRHFALSSELTGAIAKKLPHAKISFRGLTVSSINSLQIYIYTVEPVYNGHPRDWTKLAVIHRWPLYTGVVLILKRYQRSEMNIKFLEIYYLK